MAGNSGIHADRRRILCGWVSGCLPTANASSFHRHVAFKDKRKREFFKRVQDSQRELGCRKRLQCIFTRSYIKSDHWTGRVSVRCVWIFGWQKIVPSPHLMGCLGTEEVCVCVCNTRVCVVVYRPDCQDVSHSWYTKEVQSMSQLAAQTPLKFRNGVYCCVRISIFKNVVIVPFLLQTSVRSLWTLPVSGAVKKNLQLGQADQKRAGEYPCRHAARAVGAVRRVIVLRELRRDGAAVAGMHIPQGCSIWICVSFAPLRG